jgi:hypothetical protein
VVKAYGRSDDKQVDFTARWWRSCPRSSPPSESLRVAIWGVDLNVNDKEPVAEKSKSKGKRQNKNKGKGNHTVPAPTREEADPSTPSRQGTD